MNVINVGNGMWEWEKYSALTWHACMNSVGMYFLSDCMLLKSFSLQGVLETRLRTDLNT